MKKWILATCWLMLFGLGTPQVVRAEMDYKQAGCKRFLGRANEALCSTKAGHDLCLAALKQGQMNYCALEGKPESSARRGTRDQAVDAMFTGNCRRDVMKSGLFHCPDASYSSMAYQRCLEFRNGGAGIECKRFRNLLVAYADKVEQQLAGKVVGYQFVVSKRDQASIARASGSARLKQDTEKPMSVDVKYTLASVSKNISATAMMQLLAEKGVSLDAKIEPYLPYDWTRGSGIDTISFRELLSHRSGIRCPVDLVDYAGLKQCVSRGIKLENKTLDCNGAPATATSVGCYDNRNYGMVRVIVPVMQGLIVKPVSSTSTTEQTDAQNAIVAANAYADYVNQAVFAKAGLSKMFCSPTEGASQGLTYRQSLPDGKGDAMGDHSMSCGSQGWFMSSRELSKYFSALNNGFGIVTPSISDRMRQDLIGYQGTDIRDTAYGKVRWWWHSGWHPEISSEVNTLVMHYSNGVDLALIVNSDFVPAGFDWGGAVTNAMFEALAKPPAPALHERLPNP